MRRCAFEDAKCIDPTSPTLPLKIPRGPPALLLKERNVYMRIGTNRTCRKRAPSCCAFSSSARSPEEIPPRRLVCLTAFFFCPLLHRNRNPACRLRNAELPNKNKFIHRDSRSGVDVRTYIRVRVKTRKFRTADRSRSRALAVSRD